MFIKDRRYIYNIVFNIVVIYELIYLGILRIILVLEIVIGNWNN